MKLRIFPALAMGVSGFCFRRSSFLVFSLSLTVFGWQIGDFPHSEGVVHVWVEYFMSVFPWTITGFLSFCDLCHRVCAGYTHRMFIVFSVTTIIRFQPDEFLFESSISVVLIDWVCPLCNIGLSVFSRVALFYFTCFLGGHIPFMLYF